MRSVLLAAAPHRESHLHLLTEATAEGTTLVDAVIVPTARGADHVRHAAQVAAQLHAVLLVLCSAASRAADIADAVAPVGTLRWYAVDVSADHEHPLLPPLRNRPGVGGRASLSRKRNLGLLVARMLGWRTVLFLDDDIRDVDADLVQLVAGGLNTASAVALAVEDFPDNSVVCHANRLGGGDQTVFVGGAALLIDVGAEDLGFFPTVYNEDWLFLFDALTARRVRREGGVTQLRYDPFADPRRAAQEEFGDAIAEGLLAHLERGGHGVPLDPAYWAHFLRRRAAFIRRTVNRVAGVGAHPRHRAALGALAAAAARCAEIRPVEIVEFLREWRADLHAWHARLAQVELAPGVPAALRRLGLGGVVGAVLHDVDAAIIVPGFLDGPANPAHRALADALAAAGLRTAVFEPRGRPNVPGEPFTHDATAHLADLAALLDDHAAHGRRVVLVGHCYGAWLAGLLAARDDRVSEVVALMPTRCFVWAEDHRPDRDRWAQRGELLLSYPEPGGATLSAVRLPHSLVIDALRYDLPADLAALPQPILFVAGTEDEVVGVGSVERLHAECGSPDKQLHVLDVRHDYREDPAQIEQVNRCVLAWLEQMTARSRP